MSDFDFSSAEKVLNWESSLWT